MVAHPSSVDLRRAMQLSARVRDPIDGEHYRFRYRVGGKEQLLALGKWAAVTVPEARDAETHDEEGRLLGQRPDGKLTASWRSRFLGACAPVHDASTILLGLALGASIEAIGKVALRKSGRGTIPAGTNPLSRIFSRGKKPYARSKFRRRERCNTSPTFRSSRRPIWHSATG